MPFVSTSDGTEIYYTDQGTGQPVVLSHGWPLSSDSVATVELKLFADAGYRAIAHDRRGHGIGEDLLRQRHGDLRQRPCRADRLARPARCHRCRALNRRRRGRQIRRNPR